MGICMLFQPLQLCVLHIHNDDRRFFHTLELTKKRLIESENEVCSMLRMSYDVFVRSFGQETLALQNRLEAIPLILSATVRR